MGPLASYRDRLEKGDLKPDPVQALAVEKLQILHMALSDYQPATGMAGWKERFGLARRRAVPPQGLYICGDVGRGKSMLMDLFFETVRAEHKRRLHFADFMREVHDRVGAWRKRHDEKDVDPIPHVARKIAEETWLLCLDELEIRDITDALIVGRLFEHLFAAGAVVVTTSNRAPDDLYKDGLKRDKFVPFIRLIKDKLDLLVLEGPRDYRREGIKGMDVYHWPLDDKAARAVEEAWTHLAGDREPHHFSVKVYGHEVGIPEAVPGTAKFAFSDLCGKPLGPTDYRRVAKMYPTVIVTGIPVMDRHRADEARRFVTLIDALYDNQVMLICSAEAPPEGLFTDDAGAVAFDRTVSRLIEMQSEAYLGLCYV